MSIDFKKAINEYGNEIKTLSNFSDAVRRTPTQFIGYLGNRGHINMIREILQNSMDEVEKQESPATEIWITYNEDNKEFTCVDNGRGLPFKDMIRIFSSEHTSSNYEKKKGEFSSGRHGVGSKATNALSSVFIGVSYLCAQYSPTGKPEARYIEFREGKPILKEPKKYPNRDNWQGTRVSFIPDTTIMGTITTSCEDVNALISTLLPLMKIGAVINFHGIRNGKNVFNERYVNEIGISTFLLKDKYQALIPPITFSGGNDRMKADIAFTYDANGIDEQEVVYSFANMCPTISADSAHSQAFIDALCTYFRNYMNKIFLNKKTNLTIINNDIKAGLKAAVAIMHIEPMFSGQAKEIFSNTDAIPFIKELVTVSLDQWCKTHSNELQRLCNFFKSVGNLRLKTNKEKIVMLKKNVSSLTGLPSKYQKPSGRTNLELILVEGDSAMSTCREACDPTKQGLMPLRGKVKNAMTCSKEDFFKNEECKAIYTILDCGEGRRCDPNKCKFDKIIFLGDADVDGLHIRSLLLKMFLIYYRPLVEAGRVYAAVPPLYSIKNKNGTLTYFTDKREYVQYVYRRFIKYNIVKSSTGKKMSDDQVVDLLCNNINYLIDMSIISQNYAIEPNLLELVYSMILNGYKYSQIKKVVSKVNKYIQVDNKNNILVLDGLVGDEIQMAVFNQNMLKDCHERISKYIINSDINGYILNDKKVSLYQLMKAFDSFTPPNVQRYKGLGEMKPAQLAVSTLLPEYNRTLIRYTSENIAKEIEDIRRTDSNYTSLLQGVDIAGFDL